MKPMLRYLLAALLGAAASAAAAQTLRVGLAEDPDALDPTLARTFVGRIVFSALCDKLIDVDEKLNMVPQLANVFPEMSVQENLEIGALPAQERFAEQLERVLASFPMLRAMLRKRAATLSGGQRQMLGVARAMMSAAA